MTDWHRPQPGPRTLRDHIRGNFPELQRIGIYNNRTIAGSTKKSHHAEGRALDVYTNYFDLWQRQLGDLLFQTFIETEEELGVDEVIWNRRIWSPIRPVVRAYHGKSAHRDHVHVGFSREGSQRVHFPRFIARLSQLRTGLQVVRNATTTVA